MDPLPIALLRVPFTEIHISLPLIGGVLSQESTVNSYSTPQSKDTPVKDIEDLVSASCHRFFPL
jgi:hypothetical protein